jgi:hypothetical protein
LDFRPHRDLPERAAEIPRSQRNLVAVPAAGSSGSKGRGRGQRFPGQESGSRAAAREKAGS